MFLITEHAMATKLRDVGMQVGYKLFCYLVDGFYCHRTRIHLIINEQVWAGCLLLGDYIMFRRQNFTGKIAIELGAGVGFIGVLLSKICSTTFITGKYFYGYAIFSYFHLVLLLYLRVFSLEYILDIGEDVLTLCDSNLKLNADVQISKKTSSSDECCSCVVRCLDWTSDHFPDGIFYVTLLVNALCCT